MQPARNAGTKLLKKISEIDTRIKHAMIWFRELLTVWKMTMRKTPTRVPTIAGIPIFSSPIFCEYASHKRLFSSDRSR